MPIDYLWWGLMFVILLFGGWVEFAPTPAPFVRGGRWLLWWIAIAMLGWRVFGKAVK